MNIMSNFVGSLKELMIINNLSPAGLARVSGCPETTVSGWLTGNSVPKKNNLLKLSNHFNCSFDYILGLTDDRTIYRNDISSTFDVRIMQILKEKKITKNALATMCNFHSSRFKSWLVNGNIPQTENLIVIAIKLECSVEYLLGLSYIK